MKRTVLCAVILAAAGCATAPPPTNVKIEDTRIYVAPFDKTWGAAVATLAEKGLEIESIDKASGLLTTKFYVLAGASRRGTKNVPTEVGRVAYKPFSMFGMWNSVQYKANLFMTSEGSSTKVKVTAKIEGTDGSNIGRDLQSKGVLEGEILEAIDQKLK